MAFCRARHSFGGKLPAFNGAQVSPSSFSNSALASDIIWANDFTSSIFFPATSKACFFAATASSALFMLAAAVALASRFASSSLLAAANCSADCSFSRTSADTAASALSTATRWFFSASADKRVMLSTIAAWKVWRACAPAPNACGAAARSITAHVGGKSSARKSSKSKAGRHHSMSCSGAWLGGTSAGAAAAAALTVFGALAFAAPCGAEEAARLTAVVALVIF
mmetsp:Transcript_30856/g.77998  ORF Transcript_30856/g.77998 Transcript_30856/m.77998 type:complete len:225 (-) Transcript_30856:107-781(-)